MATSQRKRKHETTPQTERRLLNIHNYRFQNCLIRGTTNEKTFWSWGDVMPESIKADLDECWIDIDPNNWAHCAREVSIDRSLPKEVEDTIKELVKPLTWLQYNKQHSNTQQSKRWEYRRDCTLTVKEETITQGFSADMASSRGRGMVEQLIADLFRSETSMKVVNIGGASTINEPAVRSFTIHATYHELSETESSDPDTPKKMSESPPTKISTQTPTMKELETDSPIPMSKNFKLVPDVILESRSKEHLLIEVKKGDLISRRSRDQLRYMLMTAAIKQKTAVGVLISATTAILEKCTVASNDKIKFDSNYYKFNEEAVYSLATSMEKLLTDIYCTVINNCCNKQNGAYH